MGRRIMLGPTEEAAKKRGGPAPKTQRGEEVIRVLVVDDNAEYRDLFARILDHQPDMEVIARVGSLAEARPVLRDVDVMIIDRGLPDGDGLVLIGEARETNPGAKVLVMSVTLEQQHPEDAANAGADGILDKLCSLEVKATRVRESRFG
jgi:two-component system response regulator DesR